MYKKIIAACIIFSFISSVAGGISVERIIDDSAKSPVPINNVPDDLKGRIAIAGGDDSYRITKQHEYLRISKSSGNGKHTKTRCSIDISVIEALAGYDGEKFAVLRLDDNGTVLDHKIYRTKDVRKNNAVIFDAVFSEVIVSGFTGTYIKTVSVNTLNTTIPFDMYYGTGLRVLIEDPDEYIVWDETNISTYPDPSGWLVVWPLNGNANDITGNGRHGTITNATSTAGRSGVSNTAYYFDGDNDVISYDYPDTTYTTNTFFMGFKFTDSSDDRCVVDFRNSSGVGRTGMYLSENKYYINNATTTSKINATSSVGWCFASYPFGSQGAINYIWLGNRYNLRYDFKGWIDVMGLYNGTLTADQYRVFPYGYQGITVAPVPGTTRIPIVSENQSISASTSMTGLNIQSPKSETKNVTLIKYLTQNATLVREWDNSTHHRVDMLFTAGCNVTEGTLSYELDSVEGLDSPLLATNATGSSVTLENTTLLIEIGSLTSGQTRYFNVSLPFTNFNITEFSPEDSTPEIPVGGQQIFTASVNGTTDFQWVVNGTEVETDTATSTGSYTFDGVSVGDYNITVTVPGDHRTWILTVRPDVVVSKSPVNLYPKIRNQTIEQFKIIYSYPVTVHWFLNNTEQQQDNDTMVTAYWFNASTIGLYNVTARIDDSQVVWSVNVTPAPKTGLGDFVDETIIAAVVTVAAGYFWNRFRRRTF